ncbi:uncharacterized protein K02A2.6-like [Galendromus occidentalis]|uniref:RNA-directed DNA polymerase n=1 Tax=Galendromus occidentalis TaxID=34638 RepID=A0AAJ6QSF8_9ACAR|nr:uncharacterized protein K02A2.6-like [Galendromus occidentalis]
MFENIKKDAMYVGNSQRKSVYKVQNSPKPYGDTQTKYVCYRCGGTNHQCKDCRFKDGTCRKCKKKGHLAKVCRNGAPHATGARPRINHIGTKPKVNLIYTSVRINGRPVEMAVDTGAEVSLIDRRTYAELGSPALQRSTQKLTVANGSTLKSSGGLQCEVELGGTKFTGKCFVTDKCSILGLDWLKKDRHGKIVNPRMFENQILEVQEQSSKNPDEAALLKKIEKQFVNVLDGKLGACREYEARITLRKNSKPIFRKARPVAYSILPDVTKEIERLGKAGVIERVETSLYAAPVVVVRKSNGSIRLCADYSIGLNEIIEDDNYPLPTAEDIFSGLSNGRFFSKIDLSEAYLQVPVEAGSQSILTINTPKGLFKMKRLPFGIKTAPSIFQRLMDSLVSDLPGTVAYLDDIMVSSGTKVEHEQRVIQLFKRLNDFNLTIRLDKCSFLKDEIRFLGFILNSKGRKPDPDRIQPILDMKRPENVAQTRAFLGMLTFYNNFIADMATLREPLNSLLKKKTPFEWTTECEAAFIKDKNKYSSPAYC